MVVSESGPWARISAGPSKALAVDIIAAGGGVPGQRLMDSGWRRHPAYPGLKPHLESAPSEDLGNVARHYRSIVPVDERPDAFPPSFKEAIVLRRRAYSAGLPR
jgi:hypothetical protein